jgi:hypothetical protein
MSENLKFAKQFVKPFTNANLWFLPCIHLVVENWPVCLSHELNSRQRAGNKILFGTCLPVPTNIEFSQFFLFSLLHHSNFPTLHDLTSVQTLPLCVSFLLYLGQHPNTLYTILASSLLPASSHPSLRFRDSKPKSLISFGCMMQRQCENMRGPCKPCSFPLRPGPAVSCLLFASSSPLLLSSLPICPICHLCTNCIT